MQGLYTSSLFRYDPELFRRIGPALELGRSFICDGYQKQYSSLLVLWKGIAEYVAQRPETAVLLGAVSVSNNYHAISRELLVRYFETRSESENWSAISKAPYAISRATYSKLGHSRDRQCAANGRRCFRTDQRHRNGPQGRAHLFRQYLKLGGRLLASMWTRVFPTWWTDSC